MLTKKDIIQLLNQASFDPNEYWVTTGAAMVLYGIKEMTRDVDLGCTTKMADQLEKEGYYVEVAPNGNRRIVFSPLIEIYENWIADKVVSVEDIPTVSIDGLIAMKKQIGRKKDAEDIALIQKFLAQ